MLEQLLLIFGAKYLIILPIIICGVYFLYQPKQEKKELVILGILSIVFVGLGAFIGGSLYYSSRPFVTENITPLISHSADNGFPSDHVLLVSALAVFFCLYNRKLSISLWVLTILIAYCRVAVGVHHSVDVIGSIIISVLGVAIARLCIRYVKHKKAN